MLIGEYIHTVDEKNRISLPARFRAEVGKHIVVTRGLDTCLSLYTIEGWQIFSEKLSGLSLGQSGSRGLNRFLFGGAAEIEVDSVGRILIPDFLKKFAGLGEKVVFVGMHDRVEIWDETRWMTYRAKVEGEADDLAEKLGGTGMI